MKASFYPPAPGYEWLVKQYEQIEGTAVSPVSDKHIPRGDSAFVFNLQGQALIRGPHDFLLPSSFITTIQPSSSILEISGKVTSFIVICHTSVLSRVMNIDMRKTGGQYAIKLEGKRYECLWKDLRKCRVARLRIQAFESFIEEVLGLTYDYDVIDLAYLDIMNGDPNRPLSKILADAGVGDRFLRRHFLKRIGVSPKTLARIVRVHSVFRRITTQTPRDFMQLVCEFNYCDQSHFIHDFKSVVGESPLAFYRRNLDPVKYISGVG